MLNGQTTIVVISSIVMLSPSITLVNVYYILSFIVNLIFITQLTPASDCFLNFHIDKCLILQHLSQKTIGLAKRYGDLYVLHAQPSLCNLFLASSLHTVSTLGNDTNL